MDSTSDKDLSYTGRSNLSATDLATAHGELKIIRKSLTDALNTLKSLEESEILEVEKQHNEFQDEFSMLRDYGPPMETNTTIRKLQTIKAVLRKHNKDLQSILKKKRKLLNATKKIYKMKCFILKKLTTGDGINQNVANKSGESATDADENKPSDDSGKGMDTDSV